jgi:misacylated tRNA(Ala) deacylase
MLGTQKTLCGATGTFEEPRMTELLYQTDAYLRSFEGTVRATQGENVELDRTAFYPTGGGQPHDRGWLEAVGRRLDVTGVVRREGRIWHAVPGQSLEPGDAVRGEIDWERRYRLMRTHTALHILSALIWRDFGAPVTGGNMEPLRGRLDFELAEIPADFAPRLEEALQSEVEEARPVEIRILPREEALQIPDLIRTKVNLLPADIRSIRTVHIVGLDLQADGGTHVANTREVGPVRIVEIKSKGKSFRRVRIAIEEA